MEHTIWFTLRHVTPLSLLYYVTLPGNVLTSQPHQTRLEWSEPVTFRSERASTLCTFILCCCVGTIVPLHDFTYTLPCACLFSALLIAVVCLPLRRPPWSLGLRYDHSKMVHLGPSSPGALPAPQGAVGPSRGAAGPTKPALGYIYSRRRQLLPPTPDELYPISETGRVSFGFSFFITYAYHQHPLRQREFVSCQSPSPIFIIPC